MSDSLDQRLVMSFTYLNNHLLVVSKIAKDEFELRQNNLSKIEELLCILNTLVELVSNTIHIFLDWQYEYTWGYKNKKNIYEIPHVMNVYKKHLDRSNDILTVNEAYPQGISSSDEICIDRSFVLNIKTFEDVDAMVKAASDFAEKRYYKRFIKKDNKIKIRECIDKYTLEKFFKYLRFFIPNFPIDYALLEILKDKFKLNEIIKYIVEKWNVYIDDLQQMLAFTR